jgi:hypothetical protein
MWTEFLVVVSVELFNPTYAPSWRTILSAVRNDFFMIWVFSDDVPYKDTFFSIRIRRTCLTWDTSTHGQISVADKQTLEYKAGTNCSVQISYSVHSSYRLDL